MVFITILENTNQTKNVKVDFDDMVTDINPVVTELFIGGRRLNILSYRL